MPNKVIDAASAIRMIPDGAHVAIQGSGGGIGEPTFLLRALRQRFAEETAPRGLTLIHATGLGDRKEIGTDLLTAPGLVRRDIAGHLGMAPQMAKMIAANQIESYNFPQGVLSQMYSTVAARKPGVFTKVGLGTYIDPRLEGGKMNAVTTEDLVRVMEIDGEEWLYFPRFHIDVALIRGTTADPNGNISYEEEAALLEGISIAQAARACGGKVIVQVKYLAEAGSIPPKQVRIPGIVVDAVVVDPEQAQTSAGFYNPGLSGQMRVPLESIERLPLDERKIVARRAARELVPGAVINVGVGMPDGIAAVAAEEGWFDQINVTVEQGQIGGLPARGVIFGAAYNAVAMVEEDSQFNFYDGGGLDVAFLGMAQTDRHGNVNASKVGGMLAGCGGFINISQNAKKVVFCGTFTAKGFRCEVGNGALHIAGEGSVPKFIDQVDQITFSGDYARSVGQPVLYVTERAVFELTPEGITLIEIAPGVDLERDVLGQMGFRPRMAADLKLMDEGIFRD